MNQDLSMNANQLVAFLQKPTSEFTKADIISFIQQKDIRMVNFMYPAGDGRLKTLNFVINNQAYLEAILTCGERVDGSSLFSFIEAGSSDLYVIPRFCTAFVDPFAEIPTLSMLCSFFNKDGEHPLQSKQNFYRSYRNGISGNGRIGILCNSPGYRYVSSNRPTWLSRIGSIR